MLLVSHRGNLNGPIPASENCPKYIDYAIYNGFLCEIDVFMFKHTMYLGHDSAHYAVSGSWLFARKKKLLIHAKNADALKFFLEHGYNCFWHENDNFAITTSGRIICHSKAIDLIPDDAVFIAMLPNAQTPPRCFYNVGICSDYIQNIYKYNMLRKTNDQIENSK